MMFRWRGGEGRHGLYIIMSLSCLTTLAKHYVALQVLIVNVGLGGEGRGNVASNLQGGSYGYDRLMTHP